MLATDPTSLFYAIALILGLDAEDSSDFIYDTREAIYTLGIVDRFDPKPVRWVEFVAAVESGEIQAARYNVIARDEAMREIGF